MPLEEGAAACRHCGRRCERPARSVPLYRRKHRERFALGADLVLLAGSFALAVGLLALAVVPLFRGARDKPGPPPPPHEPAAPQAQPAPRPPPVRPAAEPVAEAMAPRSASPSAPFSALPDRAPVSPSPTAPPSFPDRSPEHATLDELLHGYALGRDGYWEDLVLRVRCGIEAEAELRHPPVGPGEEVAVRRLGGEVARGTLLALSPRSLRVASSTGELEVPLRELGFEDRLVLDPAYRGEVLDTLVAEYLFSRLPPQRRGQEPPAGAPGDALMEAARRGSTAAARRAGLAHLDDLGQAPDYARAFVWLTPAARWGDAEAQYRLGTLYYRGVGVRRDERLALAWMSRASARGHEPALHFLAGHRQRRAAHRRMEREASQALDTQMRQEAAWLAEAAQRPRYVTVYKRSPDGTVTVGSDPATPSGP
jgi:hypothetical protein